MVCSYCFCAKRCQRKYSSHHLRRSSQKGKKELKLEVRRQGKGRCSMNLHGLYICSVIEDETPGTVIRTCYGFRCPFCRVCFYPPPPPELSFIRVGRCLTPPANSGALSVRGIAQETDMNWWHKMRKAWFAISSRVKFHQAGSGGGRGGATSRSASGLLNLQDDVQMCGYKDVEVMWNMFIESNRQQMAAAVVTSTSRPKSNHNQRPSSLRSFFWCHNSATSTTTSFTSLNQVLITTAEKDTEITEG